MTHLGTSKCLKGSGFLSLLFSRILLCRESVYEADSPFFPTASLLPLHPFFPLCLLPEENLLCFFLCHPLKAELSAVLSRPCNQVSSYENSISFAQPSRQVWGFPSLYGMSLAGAAFSGQSEVDLGWNPAGRSIGELQGTFTHLVPLQSDSS